VTSHLAVDLTGEYSGVSGRPTRAFDRWAPAMVRNVEVPLHEVTCGAGGDKVAGCGHDGGALSVDRHVAV
jgi:hypothetical protein